MMHYYLILLIARQQLFWRVRRFIALRFTLQLPFEDNEFIITLAESSIHGSFGLVATCTHCPLASN